MKRSVHHTSDRQNWGTPRDFYAWLNLSLRFTIDTCAEKWNAKHRRFWDYERNALVQDWSKERGFCNPEYAHVSAFLTVAKLGALAGGVSAHLVAARPDTAWFREATEHGWGALRRSYFHQPSRVWWLRYTKGQVGIYFHDERLTFDLPEEERAARIAAGKKPEEPAPFPSAVIIMAGPTSHLRVRDQDNEFGRPLITSGAPR